MTLTDLRRRLRPGQGSVVARALTVYTVASVIALVAVGVSATYYADRVARVHVEVDSQETVQALADKLVAPLVTPQLRAGDRAALARIDQTVRDRIADESILRVKVWSADGVVLYSDAAALIGRKFHLDPADVATLNGGRADSEVSDTTRPENIYERSFGQTVEVYVGARDATGAPILVEGYLPSSRLLLAQHDLAGSFGPIVVLALFALLLLLLPMAVALARRIERNERDRRVLARRAADASASERRRLAQQLHDGVIQDLAGVGYALSAVEGQAAQMGRTDVQTAVSTTLEVVRRDSAVLRSMISNLYAADLDDADLTVAVRALVDESRREGMDVALQADPAVAAPGEVPAETRRAALQVTRESLRNAASHAPGSRVVVQVYRQSGAMVVEVSDDGPGFSPSAVHGPASGHLGMTLLRDAAASVGGRLDLDTTVGEGTTVRLWVPVPAWGAGRRAAHVVRGLTRHASPTG